MVDTHCHILPKMDDGARSVEEAIELLKMQKAQGADKIIATPHFNAHSMTVVKFLERRERSYNLLKEEIEKQDPSLFPEIYLGAEVMMSHRLSQTEGLERLTMPDGKHILIEINPYSHTDMVCDEYFKIETDRLLTPIVAHVDYYVFSKGKKLIERLLDMNLDLQISLSAFDKKRVIKKVLKQIPLGSNFVCTASDCHSLDKRPPNIKDNYPRLIDFLGEETAERMEKYSEKLVKNHLD